MPRTRTRVAGLLKPRKAPRTAFKKGDPKNPAKDKARTGSGRKKGTPNKYTTDVKQALLNAFNTVGGEDYLARLARIDRRAFSGLVGKLLPTQVTGKDGGAIELQVNKAASGLSNLDDKELAALQVLLTKAGLTIGGDE